MWLADVDLVRWSSASSGLYFARALIALAEAITLFLLAARSAGLIFSGLCRSWKQGAHILPRRMPTSGETRAHTHAHLSSLLFLAAWLDLMGGDKLRQLLVCVRT